MAGGIWTSQNKKRPGAYINFEAEPTIRSSVGTRGIATIAMELDWGVEDDLIEVTMDDLVTGKALAKTGLVYSDVSALVPKMILENASSLKIYRLNGNGAKATVTIEETLTVTAKEKGIFGNKIAILISQSSTPEYFEVKTYADGYLVDNQKIKTLNDLVENDFVTFSGTGDVVTSNTTLLSGGTNGGTVEATAYQNYFNLLKLAKWNTLAITTTNNEIITSAISFIKNMRENEGKYVQAVVTNTNANYEGIINNINGVVLSDSTRIEPNIFTAWVAGATAGAEITESLTGNVVNNAIEIIGLKSNDEIIEGLENGQFLLSYNQDGTVKVEKDINSLYDFTEKGYQFSKNRVIRELDEIGASIEDIWETTFLGKVVNNDDGIALFKASIINYLTELQNRGAITDFDAENVIVERGIDIDSVIAEIAIKPLDSMEILYMTVNVN